MKPIRDPGGLLVISWKMFSAERIDGSCALYAWASLKVLCLSHMHPYWGVDPFWCCRFFGLCRPVAGSREDRLHLNGCLEVPLVALAATLRDIDGGNHCRVCGKAMVKYLKG